MTNKIELDAKIKLSVLDNIEKPIFNANINSSRIYTKVDEQVGKWLSAGLYEHSGACIEFKKDVESWFDSFLNKVYSMSGNIITCNLCGQSFDSADAFEIHDCAEYCEKTCTALLGINIEGKGFVIQWLNVDSGMLCFYSDYNDLDDIEFNVTPGIYFANFSISYCGGGRCVCDAHDCAQGEWSLKAPYVLFKQNAI